LPPTKAGQEEDDLSSSYRPALRALSSSFATAMAGLPGLIFVEAGQISFRPAGACPAEETEAGSVWVCGKKMFF
jgi:hypothetical protein